MPPGGTRGERVAPDVPGLLGGEQEGEPPVGVLRGALDVPTAECRHEDRHRGALGPVHQLQRLAEAGALSVGQREVEDRAVVLEAFAAQRRPDDVDDLAGPGQWPVEGDAVPALHHLRTRGAQAEDRPATADVVQTRRGLREGAGGP